MSKNTAERKTVRKWIWIWDFDKEERWLNAMAREGWTLEKVGFCTYHLVKTEPDEYIVRLEIRDSDPEYLCFMEDLGAEYIGRVSRSIYFRRKSEMGAFDIFSDLDSRIRQLHNMGNLIFGLFLLNLGVAFMSTGVASFYGAFNFGTLNLLMGCILAYGLGKVRTLEEGLKREKDYHEA